MRITYCSLLMTLLAMAAEGADAQPGSHLPAPRRSFLVSAHRGDHTQAPENTLSAFSHAIKDGVDFIEIDLRTTLDSQLVIMHDASVNRMTNGQGLVKDLTYDQIRQLKVTDRVHPEWGSTQVPSFAEVLALARDKVYIYLDFKSADPAVAYKAIKAAGMEKQVVVYINAEFQMGQWRKAAPDMPQMISLPDNIKDTASMKALLEQYKVEILDGDYDQYSQDMVNVATRLGYLVFPDIQGPKEAPAVWDLPIQKGIRALQTDHPAALIAYLQSIHLR